MKKHSEKAVIVVGASGNLGQRVIKHLVENGAIVKAILRKSSSTSTEAAHKLTALGAQPVLVY